MKDTPRLYKIYAQGKEYEYKGEKRYERHFVGRLKVWGEDLPNHLFDKLNIEITQLTLKPEYMEKIKVQKPWDGNNQMPNKNSFLDGFDQENSPF